ncbi:MAG: rhombotarget lipoprotein [Gammaproteobacteria bacterium]|nr:rhombotarget lipoprotein [Gammaproteobacteria bacterium]MDH5630134.1 rhombotarget lipoprotein [Gammaproteobacteria bacterium]
MKTINWLFTLIIVVVFVFITGCSMNRSVHNKTSIMEYLYPTENEREVQPNIPTLRLPLKVGIAFVPEKSIYMKSPITETEKQLLLETVAKHFSKHQFISEIEVIPTAYLTPKGSFTNLNQIKTMYNVDVVALVSYDQTQFTQDTLLSLSYWTIIGAYIVPGDKNDTHTMVDTVVFDIESKSMLFRAPGTSFIKGLSTAMHSAESLREDSHKGFNQATEQMIKNLDLQLSSFKQKVKDNPAKAKIVHRPGYSGGGGGGSMFWLLPPVAFLFSIRSKQ